MPRPYGHDRRAAKVTCGVRSGCCANGFRANRRGDSLILTKVEIPDPCLAPEVLVLAGSEDKWFAVTGFETEQEGP